MTNSISQQLVEKTLRELEETKNPQNNSRAWKDPEGYKRTTTSEYLQFIGYSQGSLEEVKGDIRELTEDKFLQSKPGSSLVGIGINLREFNQGLREDKGNYRKLKDFSYHPLTTLYPPLNIVRVQDLTYEIFIELINKTDWLLRKLVESLENKLRITKRNIYK